MKGLDEFSKDELELIKGIRGVQQHHPRTRSQKDAKVYNDMMTAYASLLEYRPEERSELSRRYAIAITEAQKLLAWIDMFICRNGP